MNYNGHICFFPGALNLGGVGKMSINIARELIKRGYKVDFYLSKEEGEYLNQIPKEVNIFAGNGSVKSSFFSFVRYLRKESPDAVISARDYLNIASIIAVKLSFLETKSITTVRTDYSEIPDNSLFTKLMVLIGRSIYKYADQIVAVSNGVAENHARRMGLDKNDIKIIHNPAYQQGELNRTDVELHPWFSNPNIKVVIGVGRLTEQKNFSLLIKAFDSIKNKNDLRLIILGEGEQRDELVKLVKRLNLNEFVYMPGFVNNPSDYVEQASLFVMSSSWEGFGNVIVEALGVGTPVVSTACKSGPAEILENGEFGKLVPVSDCNMLAKAMEDMLNNPTPKKKLIKRAKEFSVENITDQYLKLIY